MKDLVFEDILMVRAPGVNFYVLRDGDELFTIDSGFIGGTFLLDRALRRTKWDQLPIRGIIVTHGHLDHVLNVSALAKRYGAWVAAPRADAAHYTGLYPYRGAARVCGWLEAIGRPLLGYRPFHVNQWLDGGEQLPIWGGLEVVHLPGHTDGHIGLYSRQRRLLFSADLFASYGNMAHLPPAIFNSCPALIPGSVRKALDLDIDGILPNHGDRIPPARHLERLRKLATRRKMRGCS